MFKVIVIAVDGSDHAARAAEVAIDMAKRYDAKLHVLSVFRHVSQLESTHSLVRGRYTPEPPDAMLGSLARDAVEWTAERAEELGLGKVTTEVRRGPISRTIVEYAKENDADVIVLGSRGLGDVTGMLLGSVSHKVHTLAHCTCMTVK